MSQLTNEERDNRWHATYYGDNSWYLESGESSHSIEAHCICCAYVDVINKYGGDCDLRRLIRYGMCYLYLVLAIQNSRKGIPMRDEVEA